MSSLLQRLRAQGEKFEQGQAAPRASTADAAVSDASPPREEHLDEWMAIEAVRRVVLKENPGFLEQPGDAGKSALRSAVTAILCQHNIVVPGVTREALAEAVMREIAGYGPIDIMLAEPDVTDIMINGPSTIYVEQAGRLRRTTLRFRDESHLRDTVNRVLSPLGKRVDTLSPYVDARLPDGSRINVVIPPLATHGWTVTIRCFRRRPLSLEDLRAAGTLTPGCVELLSALVAARANLMVSGAAGSGKTTLLNAMCACISAEKERVIAIEDSQELRLDGIHAVSLEARPANLEGLGEVTIRQLVRNALRMRPDRIIIGEIRDAAAFDFMQAINTGHSGSMCSIHANSAHDALYRLENLVMTSGANIILAAVRDYVASALDAIIHLSRDEHRDRRVTEIGVVVRDRDEPQAHVIDLLGDDRVKAGEAVAALGRRIRNRANVSCAAEVVRAAERLVPA